MTSPGGPSLVRRIAVYGVSFMLAGWGGSLTWWAAEQAYPSHLPFQLSWLWLLPAYVVVLQRPLEFQFRRESQFSTLTHIPMSVGLVFVAPALHLASRVLAAVVDVSLRRMPPIKAFYNISLAVAEVGIASATFATLTDHASPGPMLWLALAVSLLLVDAVASSAIALVLTLVNARPSAEQLAATTLANLGSSAGFTCLGVIAVAAAWTDPLTLALMALLATGLGVAFRRHRGLAEQANQQAELQQFLKGLGPLDLTAEAAHIVFDNIRLLMRAEQLTLSLRHGERWLSVESSERGTVLGKQAAPVLPDVVTVPTVVPHDHMATPLLHDGELIGLLTVRERIGDVHSFTLRDFRLLESVAAHLAKALERGQLQRALAEAATTDSLTQLPNLNETSRLIDSLLATSSEPLVIAAVAVDSFREVNDTLGHEVGDELLLEVTRRLRLSYSDATIGRIGGGRFAIVLPADHVGGDAAMFGLGIRAQVEGGAQLGPVGTHIRLSVGCVSSPEHGIDSATLIRRAETSMYAARNVHGGPVVWEPVYEVEGQRRLAVVMALREALSSGAIGVAFQPKVAAQDGSVTGVEALARWTHPALGAISPAEFVPLAEAAGLMGPLTSTVLRQALTACKGWQRRGGRIGVAVNVSADTILDPIFVTEVAAILTSVNIAPDLLTLELTEGVVVHDPELAILRMTEMRTLGVKISVDDFGTGYSSLTYLKGLPVDEVKIDKGFVDDVTHEAGDRAVVRAVVDIAHTLGLRVVAEGVEHTAQHEILAELGVDEIQGYLHARPMAALDMAQWLRRRENTLREFDLRLP
jgi:diguanylate cyclase (GGDEF)-like protein